MREKEIKKELTNIIKNYKKFNEDILLKCTITYYGKLNEIDKNKELKAKKEFMLFFQMGNTLFIQKVFLE